MKDDDDDHHTPSERLSRSWRYMNVIVYWWVETTSLSWVYSQKKKRMKTKQEMNEKKRIRLIDIRELNDRWVHWKQTILFILWASLYSNQTSIFINQFSKNSIMPGYTLTRTNKTDSDFNKSAKAVAEVVVLLDNQIKRYLSLTHSVTQ